MNKVIAHAPAKINLVLDVEPLRANEEKHRLNSIFCTTTLCDTLTFGFESGSEPFNAQVTIESVDYDTSFIKGHDNTLTKVVEQFKLSYGFGFLPAGTLTVELIKSIPSQAGLGGGSSDAAAMLRMLCWLAQVEPLSEKSLAVAQAVGADVPFFLHAPKGGYCALMKGFGDELAAELPKPKLHLTLIKPEYGVSTKNAFAIFDLESTPRTDSTVTADLAESLKEGSSATEIAALCANNLEPAAIEILPQIGTLKKELSLLDGVLGAAMTGSGSALYAICESPVAAQACMQHFAKQGLWSVACQT